jgi:hypothetical protein
MSRADECDVPTHLGDAPPLLPFAKPFDLNAWQLPLAIAFIYLTLSLEQFVQLSEEPFEAEALISPMMLARFAVLAVGVLLVFVQPHGRLLPMWGWVFLRHFYRGIPAVYMRPGDEHRGTTFYPVDAEGMTRMRLDGTSTFFVVDPPLWFLMRRTPMAKSYWRKHVPYRMLLPIEPQGALELMTDVERAARWRALWAGLMAVIWPVQFVSLTRPEDPDWLVEHALPPAGSPFDMLWKPIERWAYARAHDLIFKRLVVVCSAPEPEILVEHVHDVVGMLLEAGLLVRQTNAEEQVEIFEEIYGSRRFYPRSLRSFGIDDIDWVTVVVRLFPTTCVVGWIGHVTAKLPVDVALYAEPDDGTWVTRSMHFFEGRCEPHLLMPRPDTTQVDAMHDLQRVEGKLKRNEDCVMRTTLLLTMPRDVVPRVTNRLRKSGAVWRFATGEHHPGRLATLPIGGHPKIGATSPLDGASVAAVYPFGSSGLRGNGKLIGVARGSPEAITLDLKDPALNASMVSIVGATGAGKTFLMQKLIAQSGLPFVLIDMKPHLSETKHGDFYRFTLAAGGDYHVCTSVDDLPTPHPFAQTYNVAMLNRGDQEKILYAIAEQEWARAVDSLEDRIFGVDEAYRLGRTPAGKDFVERVASLGRSVGFIGLFASQELTDFLGDSQLAKAVTQSSVQFVLAQHPSMVDFVADKLKLGDEARSELEKFLLQPGDELASRTRSAIMRVGQRMCSLRIEACPEEILLYTTKPSDKRAMREAAAEGRELAWTR